MLNNDEMKIEDSIKHLFSWISQDKSSFYSKIELKNISKDHRGIYSREKIKKNEIFLIIPLSKLITLEMAKESKIGIKMINKGISLKSPKHCFLAMFLLYNLKFTSECGFSYYINTLPQSYNNFPVFYNEYEKNLLTGSPFLSK